MKLRKCLIAFGLLGALLVFLTERVRAQNGAVSTQQAVSDKRDGQHDFDFLVGTWKFHLRRLKRRLVGSTDWAEFDGTTVCRKVLDGRAEVEEMNVESPDKYTHFQGLALRLYNPEAHQWSIYWVNGADGVLEPNPMLTTGEVNSITNKYMKAEQFMRDSSEPAATRNRHTSSRRFLPMGEKRRKRTG